VLDVGCGTGVFASLIRKGLPQAKVWGIDLVAGMLVKGTQRWRRDPAHLQPVQADSERLPFGVGSFDVVTCANSFHHYPNQSRAVQEMFRVLRPGGHLILVDGFRDRLWGWFIYDVCVATVEGNVHHASASRIRELCQNAGFHDPRQDHHKGAAPFLLTEAVKPLSAVPPPHFPVRAENTPAEAR
jgi:ubiquinone/menaquinone biosynthesis C-methylase UbiE